MKEPQFSLPFRQIHLDFHTGPWIKDVGRDFNAAQFARTMKDACVNSVCVFAKCHHGHLYYHTRRPERHPGLKPGLDLLGEQVAALHQQGIRAPIYVSVQCDNYAAQAHPEWIARTPEGKNAGPGWSSAGPLEPGWQTLDMSSPYQEYLAEQLAEVLRLFKPVDGIFFDMCWDQPSVSTYAIAGLRRAGLDPEREADRAAYANRVALDYMHRFFRMVRAASPAATVFFNSRPLATLPDYAASLSHVELECLPTGGAGYMSFPRQVRFVRKCGLPYVGQTARFHKGWADFGGLKPYAALDYEVSEMMAQGARCGIGDQLHPRGRLEEAAYELIGRVYRKVAACEPWLKDATPVADIAVLRNPPQTSVPGTRESEDGAVRLLTQLHQQFDIVSTEQKWERCALVVLPDDIRLDPPAVRRLRAYLRKGGRLLATGLSGLSPDATAALLPELGLSPAGLSPYSVTYFRPSGAAAADLPEMDHVMYERGALVRPARKARSLAAVVEPYFERRWDHFSSHHQTPPARLSAWSAAVVTARTACVPYPIFRAYAMHANYPYRLLIRNLLNLMLPQPLLTVEAPTGLEATVTRQAGRLIVHLLFYTPERRARDLDLIEDIVPLRDVPLSLRLPRPPLSVRLAPQDSTLPFVWEAGRAAVTLPELRGHQMVVFELSR